MKQRYPLAKPHYPLPKQSLMPKITLGLRTIPLNMSCLLAIKANNIAILAITVIMSEHIKKLIHTDF